MFGLILEKKILDYVKKESLCNDYESDYEIITIESVDFKISLENRSFYFLISEKIDVAITARVVVESVDNILSFSKEEFEFDKIHELESFRQYLRVRTLNIASFIPYKLKFLKITPIKNL